MDIASMIDALQEYGDYHAAKKMLQRDAYGSLVFGALATLGGLNSLQYGILGFILLAVGLFLLFAGIYALAAPGPASLRMAATGFMLVGAWNVSMTIIELLAGVVEPDVFWGLVGIFQIIWGAKMLGPKSRMAAVRLTAPPRDMLDHVDALVRSLKGVREKDGEEIIEFMHADFFSKQFYRGKLMDGVAFLTEKTGTHVHFLRPEDFEITLTGKKLRRNSNKVKIRMREKEVKGTISEISLERFNRWKAGESLGDEGAEIPAAPPPPPGQPQTAAD